MHAIHPLLSWPERDSQVNGNKVERAIKNRKGGTLFFTSFVCLFVVTRNITIRVFIIDRAYQLYIYLSDRRQLKKDRHNALWVFFVRFQVDRIKFRKTRNEVKEVMMELSHSSGD